MLLESPSIYLSETCDNIKALDTLDSCYRAFNEGVTDNFIVTVAASNTQLSLFEYLDHVRDALMDFCARVLSYLNNYILNNAKLADKYRELIIERYKKLDHPILLKTYQYPKLFDKNYPILLKSTATLEKEIDEVQEAVLTDGMDVGGVREKADRIIEGFGDSVVGYPIDPLDIDKDVEKYVRDQLQGREIVRTLKKEDLGKFIDEIIKYKQYKDSILNTKKIVMDDYNVLKKMMMSKMRKAEATVLGIEDIRNPDRAMLHDADYQRFANVNTELARMFNAFIKIYEKAFNTKIQVLQEKIDENREIITRIMVETNVFAAINPHNPAKYKAPQKFGPKIKA